jgi:transcriptional regulator GlxA family with amidase domain
MDIAIPIFDRVTALDAIGPYEILSRLPGARIHFLGIDEPGPNRTDNGMLAWVRAAHETSQWTTSVCTGALILGAAGILNGLEATTHWRVLEKLGELGARPVSRRVVEQGKVITAAGVSSGIDMALTLAARIASEETARAIQLLFEYDPEPPFESGSTAKASAEVVDLAGRLS